MTIPLYSSAQNIIYKCTDEQGNISYVNNIAGLKISCSKTQLGDSSSFSVVSLSKNKMSKTTNFSQESLNNNQNAEQLTRDNKRLVILKKELESENEQLVTINNMISKASENDLVQLKEMQQMHYRNITALEKELGIKKVSKDLNLSNKQI